MKDFRYVEDMYINYVNKVYVYFFISGFFDVFKMIIECGIILQVGIVDCFVDDCLGKKGRVIMIML